GMAEDWELWHTPANEGYASILVNDHKENWLIRSQTFKRYVAKLFFDQTKTAMTAEALAATINLVEAQALFEGEQHLVYVRLAEYEGKVYPDLCNSTWQVIEITSNGWSSRHVTLFGTRLGAVAAGLLFAQPDVLFCYDRFKHAHLERLRALA